MAGQPKDEAEFHGDIDKAAKRKPSTTALHETLQDVIKAVYQLSETGLRIAEVLASTAQEEALESATEFHPEYAEASQLLTQRHKQILALRAAGLQEKEIAHRLVISRTTVRSHTQEAFRRLGVSGGLQRALCRVRELGIQLEELKARDDRPTP